MTAVKQSFVYVALKLTSARRYMKLVASSVQGPGHCSLLLGQQNKNLFTSLPKLRNYFSE